MTSTVVLTRTLARSLYEDASFMLAARDAYQKDWTMEVGFDRRRTDWSKKAPFAVFLPTETSADLGETHRRHDVALLLGVVDQEMTADAVPALSGFRFLGEVAWPLVEERLASVLPSLENRCSLQGLSVEYSQENAPLIFLQAALSIHEHIPLGRQRSL